MRVCSLLAGICVWGAAFGAVAQQTSRQVQPTREYRVSTIDLADERLSAILAAVNEMRKRQAEHAGAQGLEERSLKLLQRLPDGRWLVEVWRPAAVAGGAAQAMNLLMNRSGSDNLVPPKREGVGVVALEGSRADGDKVTLRVAATDEVVTMKDIDGVERNLRVYRSTEKEETVADLTLTEFLRRLQAGESFIAVKGEEKLVCRVCGGFGRVAAENGTRRDADNKRKCDACGGVGTAMVPSIWEVKW